MSQDPRPEGGKMPPVQLRRVIVACERYEADWSAGRRPRIEQFLADDPGPDRPALLRELLAVELELRRGAGERPDLMEYRERFPDDAGLIEGVFAEDAPTPGLGLTVTAAHVSHSPGAVIGSYKLLQQIGEGGMGTVFIAEQTEPVRRKVALKLIKPGMDGAQVLARFEAERQALALMDHPHIAKAFDGGATADGRPYFVMELVKGRAITKYCDEHRLTPRQRLELFVPVCQAVQHAHQKGIIHRDLKPSNVLVAPYDGKPVIKVIDFGVAKAVGQQLTERTLFTEFGAVLGTLEYMSPEQAELNNQDVDTRSDIYSLGVLLYELMTGTTPLSRKRLKQAAFTEGLRMIREEEPPKPSTRLSESKESLPSISALRQMEPAKLTKLIRGELDWIVMKALEKDRNHRYETANGFAMDILRYLADEPVLACPPSTAYRLRKILHQNKKLIASTAAFALVLVIGTAISIWQAVRATRSEAESIHSEAVARTERDAADAARKDAQAAAAKALSADADSRRILARQYVANGSRLLDEGNRTDALVWFVEALRKDAADAERVAMHRRRIAATAQLCPRPERIWFHSGPVSHALFSPDGRRVLTVSGWEARLWDVATGRPACEPMKHPGEIKHVAFTPDGQRLLTVTGENVGVPPQIAGEARVWDAGTGQQLSPPLKHEDDSRWPMFSADGQLLVTLSGARYENVKARDGSVSKVLRGGELRISETATGKPIVLGLTLPDGVQEARFSPDGSRLFAKNSFGQARLWDATTGQPVTDLLTHGGAESWSIRADSFSPDGKELFLVYKNDMFLRRPRSTGLQVVARVWSTASGQPLGDVRELDIRPSRDSFKAFVTEGRRILVVSKDDAARVFNAHTGQPIGQPLPLDKGLFAGLAQDPDRPSPFSPDGQRVLLTYAPANQVDEQSRGEARLWEVATGRPLTPPMMLSAPVHKFAFSADGQRLLMVEGRKAARVWDTATGRPLTPPLRHEGQAIRAALSPNGEHLLTAARNEARIWDASSGRPITPLLVHNGVLNAEWFSPGGAHVLTASQDGTARLWAITAGSPLIRRLEHDAPVAQGFFSPDGHTILSATEDTEHGALSRLPPRVRLWDQTTGQPRSPLMHYTPQLGGERPRNVRLSPDGRWLAIGHKKEVQLRNVATGEASGASLAVDALDYLVQFTPDSQGLLTLQAHHKAVNSGETEATIWDVATRRARFIPARMSERPEEVVFSPDGACLLLAHSTLGRHQAQLFEPRTGKPIIPPMEVAGLPAFSPDSRYLALAAPNQTIRVLDAKTGQPCGSPLAHSGKSPALIFLADSRTLLSVGLLTSKRTMHPVGSCEIRRWDVVTGQPLGPVVKLAVDGPRQISPDGQFACVNDGTEVRVFDLTTGRPTAPPLKHAADVSDAYFSQDRVIITFNGATIVESHMIQTTLLVRDAPTGEPYSTFNLATYRSLGEVRLWDALTGEPLAPPLPHLANGIDLRNRGPELSGDGRHLLLANEMNTLEVWDAPEPDSRSEEELVQLAQALSGRRFDEVGGLQPLGGDQWASVRAKITDPEIGHPFDLVSWYRREAIRCNDTKDWSAALRHLDPLIAARPNDWLAYLLRGRSRAELGNAEAAVTDYTRAIELGSGDFRCWSNRAMAHFALGNWKEVADDCEIAIATFPDYDDGRLANMLILAQSRLGDAAGYRRACTGFIERWGKTTDLNMLAWPCVLAPGAVHDPEKVVQWAERAYEQSQSQDTRNTLGAALYRAGKWAEAVKMLDQKPLDQNYGARAAFDWIFLSMAHHRLAHFEKAKEFLEKTTDWTDAAMENNAILLPSTGSRLNFRQRVELQGLRLEAESTLQMPPEQLNAHEEVLTQRLQDRASARQLIHKRQWTEAIRVLDKLVDADGDFRPDRVLRGNAHFELGRWEQASADYSRALELKTTATDLEGIAMRLACLRVNLGDADGYRRTCSALLEQLKDTGNPRAAYLLARICTLGPGGLADYAPAVRLAKQALAGNAKAPWNIHTLGAVYYRAGQFDKAIQYLRESTDASWSAQVCNWLMLGQVYQAMGQVGEARAWLDKARMWLETNDPKASRKSLGRLSGLHEHDALACQLLRWEVEPLLRSR
jgi:serine/threonine protein kinase/WD40 repeat protein/tetratricopeptide (TPR) repeat protein